ncbi:glutaryl-7-aminocephalosporanic-acid acylase precursor [mine drainage metagenome]|uniref:Glutaryl-7-aminocephalosporanic-acid acylase n=1 Tax=mine drainage metagenome TaxID=410659 RepID=A0A1J5SW19_9ZZZZ
MRKIFFFLLFPLQLLAQFNAKEINRYQQEAKQVTIIRDSWGIPHVYGKTDAAAVFGLLYAQCEDDFKRVEMNYIEKLGRLSEVNGEKDLYNDLLIKMIIDSSDAIKDYKNSPLWLHKLLDAFADGVNYYLFKHPETKPSLLNHFEPWYPLLWTDGSIGAISTAGINEIDLKKLYGSDLVVARNSESLKNYPADNNQISHYVRNDNDDEKLTGSNGFAFAPSITESGHAILYINPHVTFYFRPEVQMASEEGLNAYGAVTWGQFFVYQGFNEHCGWMHTSSQVDVSDAYIEKISQRNNQLVYEYEHQQKKVEVKNISISIKQNNSIITKNFKTLFTHHGPVMAKKNGEFISVRSFNRSIISLEQSWLRTKATSFSAFKKVLAMRGNTSNNTVYADAEGNIAYWHGNFVPERDTKYNWAKPVDGTIAATEWKGLHTVDEIVHSINPSNGWLQNCNSTPFSVAGINSPKKENYPRYMAPDGENFRGINAVRVLPKEKKYTIDKVIAAGYDTYLAFFEKLVPALIDAYNALPLGDSLKPFLEDPIEIMKDWDLHSGEKSVATSLAVTWGTQLMKPINASADINELDDLVTRTEKFAKNNSNAIILLNRFKDAVNVLIDRYGKWDIAWGDINRFQRLNDDIDSKFDDAQQSIPVGFTSSLWGQIPSYTSRVYPNTKKMYGVNGNSFICAVEFGKRIKAKSLLAGGESGNTLSKHFFDQAEMYSKGKFKDVLFYKEDVLQHAERTYHPGE